MFAEHKSHISPMPYALLHSDGRLNNLAQSGCSKRCRPNSSTFSGRHVAAVLLQDARPEDAVL